MPAHYRRDRLQKKGSFPATHAEHRVRTRRRNRPAFARDRHPAEASQRAALRRFLSTEGPTQTARSTSERPSAAKGDLDVELEYEHKRAEWLNKTGLTRHLDVRWPMQPIPRG